MTDPNPNSILDSVKKVVGLSPDDTSFDLDIVMHINSAFGTLQQVGVGSTTGFTIADNTTLWSQYVSQLLVLGLVKQYIFLSVKMAFDPPATSFTIDAYKQTLSELAWRINVAVEGLSPPSDPFETEEFLVNGVPATIFVVKVVQLEFAAVVTPDAGEGNTFYLTLTGDCTINAPVNGSEGEHINLELISNGHTVTWGNGWNFGSAGPPTLSVADTDIISAIWKQDVAMWYTGYVLGF